MWQATVGPAIETMLPASRRVIRHRCIKCFGAGESDLESMLPDLIRRGRQPTVGITVSEATISLRITAEGETKEACFTAMEPTVRTILDCLGDLVFGEGEDELPDVIGRMFAGRSQTLATAEWDTGGLLAHWLSEAQGGGDVFRGGIVVTGESSVPLLNRLADGAELAALESATFVTQLAAACRKHFQTDIALAVGPFAHDDPALRDAGQFECAIAAPHATISQWFRTGGHPSIVKARAAKQALNWLRLTMSPRDDTHPS
jgi:nicotinamide-nucleotide amidase